MRFGDNLGLKRKQILVILTNIFSNTDTLDDLKLKILEIDQALDRQTLDSLKLKNQSTGKQFNPERLAETTCKGNI